MEKMAKHPRLWKRGSTYYLRAAVPADIRGTYPTTEVTFSLKTRCPREALTLLRQKSAEVDAEFSAHRASLKSAHVDDTNCSSARNQSPEAPPVDIKSLAVDHYRQIVDTDFEWRADIYRRFEAEPQAFWRGDILPLPNTDYYRHLIEDGETDNDRILSYCLRHERERQLKMAKRALRLGDISDFIHLASDITATRDLIQAEIKALKAILVKDDTDTAPDASQTGRCGQIASAPTALLATEGATLGLAEGPLLSAVVREWVAEQKREAWTPKTADAMEAILNQFVDLVGDKPVGEVTKRDCRMFKSTLMKLPPNVKKLRDFRNLTIKQAAERAAAAGLKPMALTTVNKNVTRVTSFFRWAQKHYESVKFNPAEGMTVKKRTAARDDRDPFTIEELAKIFDAPVYTGCRSEKRWQHPGSAILRNSAKFWVPLIGLTTGARLGEIVQLHTADIKRQDDVEFIDISPGGEGENAKSMKTPSSVRAVPVHPLLVSLGFLDLVEVRRKNEDLRLFPDYRRSADQSWSAAFSKHFSRFLKTGGAKTDKNAFHSFRHNFQDFASNSGIDEALIRALMGHVSPGMSGRYGKGYDLKPLAAAIKMIKFEGVDLKHLYVTEKIRENA